MLPGEAGDGLDGLVKLGIRREDAGREAQGAGRPGAERAVGGGLFQKMGLVKPFETRNPAQGRYGVTHQESDRMVFKVPTLRNVELTYPYFHDGSAATLTQAVDVMGRVQLGRQFTSDENAQLVAFLKTLTGDQPTLTLPVLPPSTDATPAPHPFD